MQFNNNISIESIIFIIIILVLIWYIFRLYNQFAQSELENDNMVDYIFQKGLYEDFRETLVNRIEELKRNAKK